ncbi:unnamed protein product [Caenorhabditis brenneri]
MSKNNKIFHGNETAIRACIYYEYLNGMPIFDSYRAFCYKLGDDVVDYREFERWFYRFSDGKMDLEDEKCPSSKNDLNLMELPIEVIKEVIQNLDVMDRLILRKVCKSFQILLDNSDPGVKSIALDFEISYASITYNNHFIRYNNQYWFDRAHSKIGDCLVEFPSREWHYLIRNSGGHQKMALNDLKIVLKNPKLKLEFLDIQNISPAFFSNIHEFFEGFSGKIPVKEIKISTKWRGEEVKILEYFSSETVEFEISEIYKQPNQSEISSRIEEIVNLDYEFLKMTFCISNLDTFPIFWFERCRRVALHFQHFRIRGEDVFVFLKRILQSSKIQLFIVTSSQGISSHKHGWIIANLQKISDDFYEFPISNEEFFEVEWSQQVLRIERKTIGKNN